MVRVDARRLWTVVGLLVSAACNDGTAPQSGPPARLEIVAGEAFAGMVASTLATALAVRVVDDQGVPSPERSFGSPS